MRDVETRSKGTSTNRLKALKRQMYGRAKLDLLRKHLIGYTG
ncbi:hypothetical protein [Sphaerimonospora mesophila]